MSESEDWVRVPPWHPNARKTATLIRIEMDLTADNPECSLRVRNSVAPLTLKQARTIHASLGEFIKLLEP